VWPGAKDSEAIIKPARAQMAQATAAAAILLPERIVVPSIPDSLIGVVVNYNTKVNASLLS
jgi:hypothetical protein